MVPSFLLDNHSINRSCSLDHRTKTSCASTFGSRKVRAPWTAGAVQVGSAKDRSVRDVLVEKEVKRSMGGCKGSLQNISGSVAEQEEEGKAG